MKEKAERIAKQLEKEVYVGLQGIHNDLVKELEVALSDEYPFVTAVEAIHKLYPTDNLPLSKILNILATEIPL